MKIKGRRCRSNASPQTLNTLFETFKAIIIKASLTLLLKPIKAFRRSVLKSLKLVVQCTKALPKALPREPSKSVKAPLKHVIDSLWSFSLWALKIVHDSSSKPFKSCRWKPMRISSGPLHANSLFFGIFFVPNINFHSPTWREDLSSSFYISLTFLVR